MSGLLSLSACTDDDGIDVADIKVPEGYALSADISTIFKNSSTAYDIEADWVAGKYMSRFNAGNTLYDNAIPSGKDNAAGGLGPLYAGFSCRSCHMTTGRTAPSTWTNYDVSKADADGFVQVSGGTGFTSGLIYITRKNGSFFPDYGRVLHDQCVQGTYTDKDGKKIEMKAEGKLKVKWHMQQFAFPDGETYELAYPEYRISEWYTNGMKNYGQPIADAVKPEDLIISVRQPLRHVGMGPMMALDPVEIEALAAKSNYPEYRISEWYTNGMKNYGQPIADAVKPEDLIISVRQPLRHVGMGPMMALDPVEIEALAAKSNYPEYGISGRCNYITEKGVTGVGLSGNKAQHLDLTVELGFSSDMGATNSRFPEEVCEGQMQQIYGSMMGLCYSNRLDVTTEAMENVDLYMQCLGVPARRLGSTTQMVQYGDKMITEREMVSIGEQNFYKAKCHLCHVTTLHTKKTGSTLLNGTHIPWLGGLTIHPYSDYLLHDMGSEIMGVGLNDNYCSGLARGNEWRTTPLWGIGLQRKVDGHTYFMHDGRARNFVEAIMWHGGEGEASKNLFKKMQKKDRDALVKFLESL